MEAGVTDARNSAASDTDNIERVSENGEDFKVDIAGVGRISSVLIACSLRSDAVMELR